MRIKNKEALAGRISLITGVGRKEGLGFEISRQLGQLGMTVILTARDLQRASQLAQVLRDEEIDARAMELDVTSDASTARLAVDLRNEVGRLDILVNNAGGNYDMVKVVDVEPSYVLDTLDMNLLGAWRTIKALLPLLRESKHGRIVNVSSEHGSFGGAHGMAALEDAVAGYGISKAALNALTLKFSIALRGENILVNSICPGLTATHPGMAEMGGRPVPEGAASAVWAATLPDDGPSGGFFRDGKALPW